MTQEVLFDIATVELFPAKKLVMTEKGFNSHNPKPTMTKI